nr:M23 family metallopeptidase [Methylobacterium sp. BTF04]
MTRRKRASARVPARMPPPPRRFAIRVALGLCAIWAIAATILAVRDAREIGRLNDEAELRRLLHEERVRALTRRLVGVASHQMLEQEGLADRLADIVTRQVELEAREAALAAAAERAALSPEPIGKMRQGDLAREAPTAIARLPLREQFARIEASLDRVETGQGRTVATLAAGAVTSTERMRAALAELRLPIAPAVVPPRSPATGTVPQDAFTARLAAAETAFAEAGRWRSLAESVPLRSPIEGDAGLSSNFGLRKDPFTGAQRMHAGMDFRSGVGTPVRSAAEGRVVSVGQSGGYGNLVEVDHGHGLITRYGHLSAIQVVLDQAVTAGTIVGLVGSTGRSTGPHLHYETRLSGNALDPARFLAVGQVLLGRPAPAQQIAPQPLAAAEVEDSSD